MARLTLKQLRYFEALARLQHFGRAADVCAISQPALSLQIRELEETLGAPLFERGPRQVRPTAFAEQVLPRAQQILQATAELEALARASQGTFSGPLRLGIIPTIAPYLLPQLMRRLTEDFPGLDLSLRETVTPRLITELMEGRLDLALIALPVSEPSLEEVELFAENFVLVRPIDQAHIPVPGPESLREMRLLLLEEGHCFREQALSFCGLDGARPREVLDGSSLTTLVQMVGSGIGVTLIPEMAVPVETRLAPVSVVHFAEPQPRRTLGMVWRRSNPLAAQFRRVAETAQQVLTEGAAEPGSAQRGRSETKNA